MAAPLAVASRTKMSAMLLPRDGAVVNHGKATQLHDVHGMVDSVGNAVFIVSQHLKYRVMAGIGKFIAPRSRRYLRDPGIVVDFAVAMLAPLLE